MGKHITIFIFVLRNLKLIKNIENCETPSFFIL